MRRGLLILMNVISVLLWALTAQPAENVEGKIFYTTTNIWFDNQSNIESTNYLRGQFLPIGTKVKITEVRDGSKPVINTLDLEQRQDCIRFHDSSGKSYKIVFISRHAAAGASVWDLFKQYFSQNDPTAEGGAFSSLTNEEQKMVRAGETAFGMSKAAVIMAYGYPPANKTPSLQLNKWIYWENFFKTRAIYFKDDKVVADSKTKKPASSIDACIKACREYTSRTSEQCFDECKPK
ncbi:MAG TPA: hypothetical protein VL197_11130 [Nitrospirota bacterium]|nr:hypothetical protein [Nitrospirota bacterium]